MKSGSLYLILFLASLTLQSQTFIPGGFVSGTWESAQSPYYIQGNIEVHFDSTLIIEPGVDVLFDGSFKLTVHGLLDATGTETDSILFTATDPEIGWQGIEFYQINEYLGISNLQYCILTHGYKPAGSGGAIYVFESDNVLINHCLIEDNYASEGGGIYIDNGWIGIKNSTITNNSSIYLAGGIACLSSVPYFYNLQITHNSSGDAGGVLFAYNPNYSYPFFEYLNITNNKGGEAGGLLLDGSNTLVLNHCKIRNNQGELCGGITLIESSLGIWSPYDKSQVYMNKGGLVNELYYEGGQSTNINIDTFTVINPDSYLVYPLDKFNFGDDGILYGLIEQADTNLYISEIGSDTNDGLSPQSPLRSFDYALRKITSNAEENNTLWVLPGHYSLSVSDSATPIYLKDNVRIKATVPGEAIIDGDSVNRVFSGILTHNFTLSGLTIQNGRIENVLGGMFMHQESGGGLYIYFSVGTVDSCSFISNYSKYFGGGVYLDGNYNVNFINCSFIQNTAETGGGGLLNSNFSTGPVNIINCLFSENHSGEEGGGMTCSGDQISMNNCKFLANTSVGSGAGCYFADEMPILTNCLFSNNISENNGGGIYAIGGTYSRMINCTFSDNQAVSGSAIYQIYLYRLHSLNSIFWNTTVPTTDLIHVKSTGNPSTTGFYTNYTDLQGGEASIVLENGGSHWQEGNVDIKPEFIDPENGDYSLNWNSPCIEAGKEDTTGLHLPQTDLNGDPRIVNDRVDMGAYEFQFPVSIYSPKPEISKIRVIQERNPSVITIEFPENNINEELMVRLINMDGRTLNSAVKNPGDKSLEIPAQEIPTGIYLIVISDPEKIIHSCKILVSE